MIDTKKKNESGSQLKTIDEQALVVRRLITLVGKRVSSARKHAGYSRRELSEMSGVSQRYLVQLEKGQGNISIGLLSGIAAAFKRPINSFLADDDAISVEAEQIAFHYALADATTRAKVQELLMNSESQHTNKAQRVCLIGLRGAGKSTLGAMIGEQMACDFVELNDEIERAAGMPVSEVIALYGQEGYREFESTCLNTIINTHSRLILAVAGGVVSNHETFQTLLTRFHTVWVKANPEEHMARVRAQGDMRPMADNPQAMAQLRQILKTREGNYGQADYQLKTTKKSLTQSMAELNDLIVSENLLENN